MIKDFFISICLTTLFVIWFMLFILSKIFDNFQENLSDYIDTFKEI